VAVELLVIRRVSGRSGFAVVSVTVGVLLALNGITEGVWHPVLRGFPPLFPRSPTAYLAVGGARLRFTTLGTLATTVAVLVLLAVGLRTTKLGLAFRAVSSDRDSSALVGIRVGRVMTTGWALPGRSAAWPLVWWHRRSSCSRT
jgi:branched-chain amino acid transport system permease protein